MSPYAKVTVIYRNRDVHSAVHQLCLDVKAPT